LNLAGFAATVVENASSSLLESFEGLEPRDVWAQPQADANPIAWMVGHLACHLDALQSAASGAPRLFDDEQRKLFRPGIVISEVLPHLPPFSDAVEGFLMAREAALAAISSATEEELCSNSGRLHDENLLDSSKRVALHLSLHLGQALLVRKLLGKACAQGFFRGLKPHDRRAAMERWEKWWAQEKNRFNVNPHAQPVKGN